jgi:hypothetical protein
MKIIKGKKDYSKTKSGIWVPGVGRSADSSVGGIFLPVCGLVTSNISPNCTDVNINGVDVSILIANWSHVSGVTQNSTTKAVETITMTSSNKFFTWEGKKTSNNAKESLVKGALQSAFSHEVSGVFFDVTASGKLQLQAAANGLVMVIIKYKYKGTTANCKYALHGFDQGLELSILERDQSNGDNKGAYAFTLKTPDGYPESKLPLTIWVTSEAATDAVVAGVTAP